MYKSKNAETDLHERKEIERWILLCPEYKDFINKYYDFLRSVQDEEDNEQESEDKLLHLMRMKTKISENYSIKPVLKQKEYINHIKTDIQWVEHIWIYRDPVITEWVIQLWDKHAYDTI